MEALNAGEWHNFQVYQYLKTYEGFDTYDPDMDTLTSAMLAQSSALESSGTLPSGSTTDVITPLTDILSAAYASPPGTFQDVIDELAALHASILNNTTYNTTAVIAITSIAYNSSVLWSQVIDNSTSPPAPMSLLKWLRTIAADCIGALVGGVFGSIVGPGGTVVGAIIGGVGASIATALE